MLIRRTVVVEGPDVALSGRGAEPGLAPSPPLSPNPNRDILDTQAVAEARNCALCLDPKVASNHRMHEPSYNHPVYRAWCELNFGDEYQRSQRYPAPADVEFHSSGRCAECGVPMRDYVPYDLGMRCPNSGDGLLHGYAAGAGINPDTWKEAGSAQDSAPPVLGDPLSWFQETRESLKRHEYNADDLGAAPRYVPGAVSSVWGVESVGAESSASVVSLAEYRGRP